MPPPSPPHTHNNKNRAPPLLQTLIINAALSALFLSVAILFMCVAAMQTDPTNESLKKVWPAVWVGVY